jgi:peptidoglycan/xylan/chitin deacetylase (PgdA/CDA1 family)
MSAKTKPYVGTPYPYTWPNGASVAVLPSVVFELWSAGTTPAKNIPHGFIGGGVGKLDNRRDLRVEMMIEFGGKVGMERLLELLERENALCSVLANGRAVEMYPDLVREYHRRGHEITGHSYTEDISSYDFNDDPELERRNIRQTAEAIERVTGERPVGWLSPRATPSVNTLRLVAEEGLLWSGDYPDDELPQVCEFGGRSVVTLPYSSLPVNDYQITMTRGNPPSIYVEEFCRTLDLLREEASSSGRPGLLRCSVHAHVYGHSWGRWAFRDVIRYAKGFSDVLITTRASLAKHILAQYVAGSRGGAAGKS